MPDIKQLKVKIGADLTGLDKGLQAMNSKLSQAQSDVQSKYGTLAQSATRIGIGMSVAITAPLILAGRAAITAGMNATETQNKFDVAFKGMATSADTTLESFSKLAGGLNEFRLKDTASSFKLLFNAMELPAGQATEMSTALAVLSYDISSLYNTSRQEASTRLLSGIVGETEAVRRFGVDISEASLKLEAQRRGLGKSVEAMSQSEKVMLRYNMIMRQSVDAQGDLIRTQDQAANKTRSTAEKLELASIQMGEKLMPIYLKATDVVSDLATRFTALSDAQQTNIMYTGLAAAVAGPVILALSQVATGILAITRYRALQAAATATALATEKLATAATVTATTATVTQTGALATQSNTLGGLALLQAQYAKGQYLMAGASTTATGAIVKQTKAMRALAAARLLLNPVVAIPAIAAAIGGAAIAYQQRVGASANTSLEAGSAGIREAEKARYAKESTTKLTIQLATAERSRARAQEALDRANDRSATQKWGTANIIRGYERQYEEANTRVILLKRQIAVNKAASAITTKAAAELSADQKKELAANEKANADARSAVWVMNQATEAKKEEAQARVEYWAEVEKINTANKSGLDVTDQLALAAATYTSKVKAIAEQEKEAAAQLTEEAVVKAEAVRVASNISVLAGMEASALASGNKYAVERVGILTTYAYALEECSSLAEQGLAYEGKAQLAYAQLVASKDKSFADELKEKEQAEKDSLVKARDIRQQRAVVEAEMWSEPMGVAAILHTAKTGALQEAMMDATDPAMKGLLNRKLVALDMSYAKEQADINKAAADERMNTTKAFADKARQWKDEEIRGWEDRMKAQHRYMEQLRGSVRFMSGTQIWEEAALTSARNSIMSPFPATPPPSREISEQDTARYWDRQSYENAAQIAELQKLTASLQQLANGGAR